MTAIPVDRLAQALDGTGRLVAGVRSDQWGDPTPCTEWTVRQLVNHVVGGQRVFVGVLRGDLSARPPANRPAGLDVLGSDPVAAYRNSADSLLSAFGEPGALERVVSLPIGEMPGVAALHLRVTESLAHGWDLARATGQSPEFPEDLAEQALAFTRGKLADIPEGHRPFAPAQPVAEDAPAIDRLAALLGRPV